MALVIPQLSAALLAVIFLHEFINSKKEDLWQLCKKCLYVTAAVALFMGLFYFFSDFTNTATTDLKKTVNEALNVCVVAVPLVSTSHGGVGRAEHPYIVADHV